jgi:DNA end-binding protein Ku
MAAIRAQWKGVLKLALVSCPVALYTATSKEERTSLHTVNRSTGHRVKREYVDEETGRVVSREDQVKGYEIDKDEYVIVTPEEIEAALPESTKTIDLEHFVKEEDVDEVYFGSPYYLAPTNSESAESFNLIREAMKAKKVVGISRTVLFRRDRLLLLRPDEKGILVSILHFDYEVKSAEDAFEQIPDVKVTGEMLELAQHIIKTKKGKFQLGDFEDRYERALQDLIQAKLEGRKIKAPAQPKSTNVVNLLDALRESAGKAEKPSKASRKKPTAKARPRGEHRRKAG